jgi:hypothetical protein
MKDWCLQHPYLTFVIVMSGLSTFASVVNKIFDIFVKPNPTTVNMMLDPSKIRGLTHFDDPPKDDSIH